MRLNARCEKISAMQSKATSVRQYLSSLPADRRKAIEAIRKVIRSNIDKPFEEGVQYGMLGYYLPHSAYPAGYHCDPKQPLPFASIASQKNYISLYLFCIYTSPDEEARFREEWRASGKRLDMGKSCVRVKKLEDVPLEVVGRAFKRITAKKFVASYEAATGGSRKKKVAKKKVAKKSAAKKSAAKKSAAKRSAAKKVSRRTTAN
jgi:hypothetical protein